MTAITVRCEPAAGGWTCQVSVDDGDGRPTAHVVTVAATDLARLDPRAETPDELVRPILARFDLMVIARYFPEFEHTIRR